MKKTLFLLLVAPIIISCSKDSPRPILKVFNYTAHIETYTPFVGENLQNEKWESDNTFVATMEGSQMYAKKVGKATFSNGRWRVGLTVEPRYSLFENDENNCILNASFSFSIGQVERLMQQALCENPEYFNGLEYVGYNLKDNNVRSVLFHFTDNNLDFITLGVSPNKLQLLKDWLHERYALYQEVSNYDLAYAHYNHKNEPNKLIYVSIGRDLITVIIRPVKM